MRGLGLDADRVIAVFDGKGLSERESSRRIWLTHWSNRGATPEQQSVTWLLDGLFRRLVHRAGEPTSLLFIRGV